MHNSGTYAPLKSQKQWWDGIMKHTLIILIFGATICPVHLRAQAATSDVDAALKVLRTALLYGDTEAKIGAVGAIAKLGRNGEGAAGQLLAVLSDKDHSVRLAVLDALGRIGPSTKEVVAAMIKLIGGNDIEIAKAAARVLRTTGPGASQAVDALLLKYAKSKDGEVRDAIIDALGMIGPSASRSVPMMIKTFKRSSDYNLRGRIAYALGNIGQPIETVVPALMDALSDKHSTVRERGARGLGMIGPKAASSKTALRKALDDTNPTVASRAAWALVQLGANDKQTVAALIKMLHSSQEYALAAEALGRAGKPGIDALIKMLARPDAPARLMAVRALGQIGRPAGAAAAAAVKKATADKDANVRKAALLAFKKIFVDPVKVVNILAVRGKHSLVCRSSWHSANKSWPVEDKICISGTEALAMINPKSADGQYDLSGELAISLGERVFKTVQFTPAQELELAKWLGSGKKDAKSSVKSVITAVSKTHTAANGTRQVELFLKGRIDIELSHRLESRYGPNWNEAKWAINITGKLTIDSASGQISKASIATDGYTKGRYGAKGGSSGEIYTESFKLTLAPAAPVKPK
jgi:HEAT repeat protein